MWIEGEAGGGSRDTLISLEALWYLIFCSVSIVWHSYDCSNCVGCICMSVCVCVFVNNRYNINITHLLDTNNVIHHRFYCYWREKKNRKKELTIRTNVLRLAIFGIFRMFSFCIFPVDVHSRLEFPSTHSQINHRSHLSDTTIPYNCRSARHLFTLCAH